MKYAVVDAGILGAFSHTTNLGWRFIPWNQRSPSRKFWPTPNAALPAWTAGCAIIEAASPAEAMETYAQKMRAFEFVRTSALYLFNATA